MLGESLDAPIRSILSNYQRGAKQRGLEFDLSFKKFKKLIQGNCVYCMSEPRTYFKKEGARYGVYYNGIDRVDNSRGYVKGNVVSCCKFCNYAKKKFSADEFRSWLRRVAHNLRELVQ